MKIVIAMILLSAVALSVTGCKTGMQQACSGHGGVKGYSNGQTRCGDGTWQS